MAAKDVIFGGEARATHGRRREHPRQRSQSDPGPEGPQRGARALLRRPHRDQGRRVGRQGNRTEGQAPEHGRADGQGSRFQDQRQRR